MGFINTHIPEDAHDVLRDEDGTQDEVLTRALRLLGNADKRGEVELNEQGRLFLGGEFGGKTIRYSITVIDDEDEEVTDESN